MGGLSGRPRSSVQSGACVVRPICLADVTSATAAPAPNARDTAVTAARARPSLRSASAPGLRRRRAATAPTPGRPAAHGRAAGGPVGAEDPITGRRPLGQAGGDRVEHARAKPCARILGGAHSTSRGPLAERGRERRHREVVPSPGRRGEQDAHVTCRRCPRSRDLPVGRCRPAEPGVLAPAHEAVAGVVEAVADLGSACSATSAARTRSHAGRHR